MAVQHTWKIRKIATIDDGTKTVKLVNYKIESSDGENFNTLSKIIGFDTENIENFINYENLTEEIILNWVKTKLGEEKILELELESASNLTPINQTLDNSAGGPPKMKCITTELPWT